MKVPHLPYDIDALLSGLFLIVNPLFLNIGGFFDYFGVYSGIIKIFTVILGSMTTLIWIAETIQKLRK
jgi:hypothetical protein